MLSITFPSHIWSKTLSLSSAYISKMAEAPRNPLPSGYDEDFVNAVEDDFQCLICQLPQKEPVLTRCGHRFCKECLEEHLRRCGFVISARTLAGPTSTFVGSLHANTSSWHKRSSCDFVCAILPEQH